VMSLMTSLCVCSFAGSSFSCSTHNSATNDTKLKWFLWSLRSRRRHTDLT
jgi:hypothetical protein